MLHSDDIVLHHYDASPFSNKVRMLLGVKGLAWKSVVTPNMMPKPDLVPLTGGYRRAPVMQIGADIYCDSQVIMAEIERRHPEPNADFGASWPINQWADRMWFQHSVAVIFGLLGDKVDPAFVEDREKLSGRPFDVKVMAAAVDHSKTQWRAQAAWIEQALAADGREFLFGSEPSIGDLAAHMNIWFVSSVFPEVAEELVDGLDLVHRWRARLEEFGQGSRHELDPADALVIAAGSEPESRWQAAGCAQSEGLLAGDPVIVSADDYGRDPIRGDLVALTDSRIVIRRSDDATDQLNIHFPRTGFVLARAD